MTSCQLQGRLGNVGKHMQHLCHSILGQAKGMCVRGGRTEVFGEQRADFLKDKAPVPDENSQQNPRVWVFTFFLFCVCDWRMNEGRNTCVCKAQF